ncbi:hypothetical protein HELRODRAFT_180917 [Helobdella robusta]|uniref:DUF4371 domain-containing protein n=1 Tax=Helobdella robusta TaxID=6412 RepID=T1FGE9_HELRO|nr:hypothetical protein HELRODRAFT_180917 [Helobdella robusta]ESN93388.1 hypothetical protein HELRODRAFT_180917 [Helobdella robusta]
MSDGKKRLSGSQYAKLRKDKELKNNTDLDRTKKINKFFQSAVSGSGDQLEERNDTEDKASMEILTKLSDECLSENVEQCFRLFDDPALWQVNNEMRDFVAKYGFKRNENMDFSKSKKKYSDDKIRSLTQKGFNDWKNAYNALKEHENSLSHRDCVHACKTRGRAIAGKYSGLQAQIKEVNHQVAFIPCSAHSLNLVGTNAAESCAEACNFFWLIQHVYNFFSASTARWENCGGFVLECLNKSNVKLQKVDIDLSTVIENYDSLLTLFESLRERFEDYEKKEKSCL